MKQLDHFNTYFFVFAHPDDEVYSCVLARRLVELGKEVHMLYLTSGDSGGDVGIREKELRNSLSVMGIEPDHLHLLRFSESTFLSQLEGAVSALCALAQQHSPDCVIGHSFEGGHEVHDASSFCATTLVRRMDINGFFTFPSYFGKPHERVVGLFSPPQKETFVLYLSGPESDLKKNVIGAHLSQKGFFDRLDSSNPDNLVRLFSREPYSEVAKPIHYQEKPMEEVGYEYHRNGFKFTDFQRAIQKIP